MKFGLEVQVIENIISVLEQYPKVDKAFVFGSRAKGNYRPDSDIDIAIKGNEITTDDIIAISVAIETKGITHKFDLIDYDSIKEPALKEHIDRVGIEFYSTWKEYKLGEIATIVDCEHKTAPIVEFSDFISVRTSNISNGKIDFENSNRVSEETYIDWTKRLLPNEGDIILAREAPVGEVGWIKKDLKVCLGQRTVLIRVTNDKIAPKYLLYYLVDGNTKYELISRATGSVVEHLNVKDIKNFAIKIHRSIVEQTSIANTISSLDDKIDLLHRQNKTLEQLAEMLFRQWFVEEAEESWEEICLSEIAIHSKESVNPSKNPTTLYKHFSLPAFDIGKEPIIEIGKEILSNKYKVISDSILVSKLNPRTPRIWMLFGDINENECICSTEFQIVKPKSIEWFGFIYCFLKSNQVTQELGGASSGTSGSHQRVNPQDIFNLSFSKPPLSLVQEFSKITNTYWIKIKKNQTQIRTLTQTRDALLPKLMSGEVRVKM